MQYLIGHHTADEFPFLAIPANTRHRTTFHMTIARLLFTTAFDECSDRFERFMEPIEEVLAKLMQTPSFRPPEVREAVIGVCRDLRGIVQQTHNRRTYSCIFDLLYPTYFPVFVRAAEELYDSPAATTALLKFLQELAYNKAQRGMLLFRELSNVVVAYGSRIQAIPAGKNPYADKYKGVSLCLAVLYRALGTCVSVGGILMMIVSLVESDVVFVCVIRRQLCQFWRVQALQRQVAGQRAGNRPATRALDPSRRSDGAFGLF